MKKVLSVLLIIAMVLSLTSCGTQTITRDAFKLKIKGAGSKKLTMTIEDRLEEYTERNFSAPENEELKLNVSEKVKGHSVTYTITATGSGSVSAYTEYLNGDMNVGDISFQINVDEKGKIGCENVFFGSGSKYQPKESEDQEYEISDFEGETKTIKLANGIGEWKVGTCDKIVEVIDTEKTEEYTAFTITAKKAGEGIIQLTNRKEAKQIYFNLKVEQLEDGNFLLSILSAEKSEFTSADDKELIEKKEEAKEEAKEVIEEYYIPDWAYIADLIKYNSKGKTTGKTDLKPDTVDATIESVDALYDYVVSKGVNYDEKIKEYHEFKVESEQDMKIGEYTIHYMFVNEGFGVAIWKAGDYVSVLTVMQPNTDAECQKAVRNFFG